MSIFNFGQRKFIITAICILLGTGVTVGGMYLKVDPAAGFYLLMTTAIASYNWADRRKDTNDEQV